MKSYHNIETRKFPGCDYYVGYGGGFVWHIYAQYNNVKRKPANWCAFKQENTLTSKSIKAKTLAEMSKKLEQL